ncbi:MAG: hypothetical protein AAF481_11350 [Acidobacteriota bacterium]
MERDLSSAPDDLDVPAFEPDLHIAPTELFRRLADGEELAIYDLREKPSFTLRGAHALRPNDHPLPGAILIDDDGTEATDRAREEAGNIRALYGGINLYRFALNPAVVGDRFLKKDA